MQGLMRTIAGVWLAVYRRRVGYLSNAMRIDSRMRPPLSVQRSLAVQKTATISPMASKKNFVFQCAGSVPVSAKVCTCFSHVPQHGERTYVHRSAVQQTRSSRFVAISKHSLSRDCTTQLQSRSADFGADHLDPPFITMILARTQNLPLPKNRCKITGRPRP